MIRQEKIQLISELGTDVEIHNPADSVTEYKKTKMLLGRRSKVAAGLEKLESYKRGIFFPDEDIEGGFFVYNRIHEETYVVGGVHKEYYGNETLSLVTDLLKCNRVISIADEKDTVDSRGNIKKTFSVVYEDMPCFLEPIDATLRQKSPGIMAESEFLLYTTALKVSPNSQVIFNVAGESVRFKVVSRDYMTVPNLLILEIRRDVR